MEKDYYDILGIPINASAEDIQRSYRLLAHQYHPDKNNGNDRRFKEINEAYRILSGENSRKNYDSTYNHDKKNYNYNEYKKENVFVKSLLKKFIDFIDKIYNDSSDNHENYNKETVKDKQTAEDESPNMFSDFIDKLNENPIDNPEKFGKNYVEKEPSDSNSMPDSLKIFLIMFWIVFIISIIVILSNL